MKRIILLFIVSCLFCFTLTGCGITEVYNKKYLQSIYISLDGNEIWADMSFFDGEGHIRTSGENLDEIRQKSELLSGKIMVTGHTEIVMLGDCDISGTLEFLLNEWKVSPSCYVVAEGDNTEYFDDLNSYYVIKNAIQQKKAPKCDLISILSQVLDKGSAETIKFNSSGNFESAVLYAAT